MAAPNSPKSMVKYDFGRPQHDDPERLKITWCLRSQPVEPPYSEQVIKSRPPFFASSFVSATLMPPILGRYFPKLELRSSYKHGLFGGNPYKHLLLIYELEGYLQQDQVPRVAHILAGMNHFAQYMQDVVQIIQQPIKLNKNVPNFTIKSPPPYMNKKRLIIFLVHDQGRDHYCLAWYDQFRRRSYLVDSHQDGYNSMPPDYARELGMIIRRCMETGKCAAPITNDINFVPNTSQMSDDFNGALHTINNLRMRLLESDERVRRDNHSGYVDWPNSFFLLTGMIAVTVTREDAVKDMMITAFKIELGSNQTQLRWPEQPTISDSNANYMRKDPKATLGIVYRSNSDCAPPGTELAVMSKEQVFEDLSGYRIRSASVLALHIFAESRQPTEALGIQSRRGTPVETPRGSAEPRKTPRQLITPLPNFSQLALAKFRTADSNMTDPSNRRRKEPERHPSLPAAKTAAQTIPTARSTSLSAVTKGTTNLLDSESDSSSDDDPEGRRAAREKSKKQREERKKQRIQAEQAALRQQLGQDKTYNMRPRMGPPATRPPVQPEIDYWWWEPNGNIFQMDVDDNFLGWEFEMKKEKWQKGVPY